MKKFLILAGAAALGATIMVGPAAADDAGRPDHSGLPGVLERTNPDAGEKYDRNQFDRESERRRRSAGDAPLPSDMAPDGQHRHESVPNGH